MLSLERLEARDCPSITINDVAITEPDVGTLPVSLTVRLSAPLPHPVTVQYATYGRIYTGTAKMYEDFLPIKGTLTFAPGQTSQPLVVPILGDTMDEPPEALRVSLHDAAGDVIADNAGHITQLDNDEPPVVSVSDATVVEGDAGTTNLVFTLSLSSLSGKTVWVDFATRDDTATAGQDYLARSSAVAFNPAGSVFNDSPGQTVRTVTVQVSGDVQAESDEAFYLDLIAAANAVLLRKTGTGVIMDND